jgi:2,4-dienoyl-CoA reductase-like NADH-dependent reductase (Old Yellow Enzyme family)
LRSATTSVAAPSIRRHSMRCDVPVSFGNRDFAVLPEIPSQLPADRRSLVQQPTDLARAHIEHMCRRDHRHTASRYLRQNLDPLQITLAHRYQSHLLVSALSNAGSVTLYLC